jgi:membrane protein implicated in regulation of membrane protease activity
MNWEQAMIDFASGLQWWHWWIAAALLGIIEALVPGAVAIWFAAAAAAVGALLLVIPINWQLQLVLFGALSLSALAAWRYWKREHPETSALPMLNQRSAQYIGEVCVLSEPIVQGSGKARVGDGFWKVRGPDLPAGTPVRVKAVEGVVLIVEAT